MGFSQTSFSGKRALVRVDFNVPIDQGEITDDSRIKAALPTINHILSSGGSVVLMSHMGRPKGEPESKYSLSQIVNRLSELLNRPVQFADDCVGSEASSSAEGLKPGDVLLLENLRFHKEEKAGDREFAEKLAKLGDVYVNDAFGTAHRAHSSTATVAQFFEEKHLGYVMEAELENAKKVSESPQAPFTAIVGGAKVSDKILIVENLLNIANHILIGGGMAYTFFKAQGGAIGNSLLEEERLQTTRDILEKAAAKGVNIHLPVDSVCGDNFAADADVKVMDSNAIEDGWMGLDIGPKAVEAYSEIVRSSKTILWNGPMGVFEMEAFSNGTKSVAQAVAEATKDHGAFSLIGGGDSAAAVYQFGLADQVSYVSTGGGALLEYFEGKTLPGVAAIGSTSS
jgi:phosphoglycerate kinase